MHETDPYLAYCFDEACITVLNQWLAAQRSEVSSAIPTGFRPATKMIDGIPIGEFVREN